MKVYCASMTHESNSFSPLPTNMDSFRESFLYVPSTGEGKALLDRPLLEANLRSLCLGRGWQVIDGLYAGACPSAPTIATDYKILREEMLQGLRDAIPVDMVLLFLHGAQMAEDCDDSEGDILAAMRNIVGPDIPIGIELDLHCNITPAMTENATLMIACKEYPHTDFDKRAKEIVALTEACVKKEISPVMWFERVPMLGYYHTTREPMRGFVDSLFEEEKKESILSVSLAHGFPATDFADVGAGVLVVADGDLNLAKSLAEDLARKFFSLRESSAPSFSVKQALEQALATNKSPVVIADASDNAGGGAASDSTHFLRAIIEGKVNHVGLGMIWDPAAYDLIEKAGVGATIPLRIGGKYGPLSGGPVDATVDVIAIRDDLQQFMFGEYGNLGPAAAIRIGTIDIIINKIRQQLFSPKTFEELGIDLSSKKIIVVKSAQHFHTAFSPIAKEIIYASPPGSVTTDFREYNYQNIQRPLWPLDDLPFTAFGKTWS